MRDLTQNVSFYVTAFLSNEKYAIYTSCMREINNEGWGRGHLVVGGAYYSHASGKK